MKLTRQWCSHEGYWKVIYWNMLLNNYITILLHNAIWLLNKIVMNNHTTPFTYISIWPSFFDLKNNFVTNITLIICTCLLNVVSGLTHYPFKGLVYILMIFYSRHWYTFLLQMYHKMIEYRFTVNCSTPVLDFMVQLKNSSIHSLNFVDRHLKCYYCDVNDLLEEVHFSYVPFLYGKSTSK